MIAVRPPEYFPGQAYFALMHQVDTFVLADTFQYSRQSFQNRARLRTPTGWQWASVPLLGGQHGRPILDVQLDPGRRWQRSHQRSLTYNYRATAWFEYYEHRMQPLFLQDWPNLADLTCATVALLRDGLHLSARLVRASALPGKPQTLPDVLAAIGDHDLLAPAPSAPHDVAQVPSVRVFTFEESPYRQHFAGFVPGMSALDLLFNYGPEAWTLLLADS
jgi:hypothetical protein